MTSEMWSNRGKRGFRLQFIRTRLPELTLLFLPSSAALNPSLLKRLAFCLSLALYLPVSLSASLHQVLQLHPQRWRTPYRSRATTPPPPPSSTQKSANGNLITNGHSCAIFSLQSYSAAFMFIRVFVEAKLRV